MLTVGGAEILDETFRHMDPIVVRQEKQGYVRLVDARTTGPSQTLTIKSIDSDNVELDSAVPVTVTRVGTSSVFIGPVTLLPKGDTPQGIHASAAKEATSTIPIRSIPDGLSDLLIYQLAALAGKQKSNLPYYFQVDFADPNGNSVQEQYTVIEDKTKNYAEKNYLLVTVRKHSDHSIWTKFAGCAALQETAVQNQDPKLVFNGPLNRSGLGNFDSNVENGGDLIFSPDASVPEGSPGLPLTFQDGKSLGREGEPTLFVRAVARSRKDNQGAYILDFYSVLNAVACGTNANLVDTSLPTNIGLWVDQYDYFPRSNPVGRHANHTGTAKITIDWIEKEAFDILSSPTSLETDAFNSVTSVLSDKLDNPNTLAITGPDLNCPYNPAAIDPDLYHWVHFNPFFQGLRWGRGRELNPSPPGQPPWPTLLAPLPYKAAGADQQVHLDRFELFESALSHEARHSLHNAVTLDIPSTNDIDHDVLPFALQAGGVNLVGSEGLLDTGYGTLVGSNPMMDFRGEDTNTATWDCRQFSASHERDALLHQRNSRVVFKAPVNVITPTPSPLHGSQQLLEVDVDAPIIPGTQSDPYLLNGNIAQAKSSNCGLSGNGVATPKTNQTVIISMFLADPPHTANVYYVFVTPPSTPPQGTCNIDLTPLIPADRTDTAPGGVPLSPGVTKSFQVPYN